MTTSTEFKLDESKYFYTLLSQNLPNGKEFDYLLNAFVSSARSVTWIMRREFKQVDGWQEWFQSFAADKEQQLLLLLINTLRVESTKRAALRTDVVFSILMPSDSFDNETKEQMRSMDGKAILVEISDKRLETNKGSIVIGPATVQDVRRSVRNIKSDEDIMEVCKKYLSFLDTLVKECLSRFKS